MPTGSTSRPVEGKAEMNADERTADSANRAFMDPAKLDVATAFWVNFLDVMNGFPEVRRNHQRAVELLRLRDGSSLLDVGCGTGGFARDMALIVGETGRVVG